MECQSQEDLQQVDEEIIKISNFIITNLLWNINQIKNRILVFKRANNVKQCMRLVFHPLVQYFFFYRFSSLFITKYVLQWNNK